MHPRLLELVLEHRSTLIFVNARRLAERLATRLNELHWEGENRAATRQEGTPARCTPELVKAHHGSLSRERRLQIEDELKSGRLKGLVATSSLELGIDMGAVDLVVQVESPGAVATGLQRIGRAGHQVGAPSRGKLFPKHRADLLEAAVVVERMQAGQIEETHYPRNPLDVLCQQIVAMCALDEWSVDELAGGGPQRGAVRRAVRRGAGLGARPARRAATRPRSSPSCGPASCGTASRACVRGRAGAQRLAVTNPGTIPDRGLFTVTLPDGTRVGELDEEMVYESRPGETFLLGASTWRIEEITFQKVIVTPGARACPGRCRSGTATAPAGRSSSGGPSARSPASSGRPRRGDDPVARLRDGGLDERAATNLVAYLDEQAEATGVGARRPHDRGRALPRRDRRLAGVRAVAVRRPGARAVGDGAAAPAGRAVGHGRRADVERRRHRHPPARVGRRAARRGAAHRPRRGRARSSCRSCRPRRCSPAASASAPAGRCCCRSAGPTSARRCGSSASARPTCCRWPGKYPSFPILLEATRECLNDVFDVPALIEVLRDLRSRKVRLVSVDSQQASPFAQSLMFGWIAVYMYEGDAPLAERRAAALALDRDLLRDLLGAEELRELIDADVLADLELELQRLVDGRLARDVDEAARPAAPCSGRCRSTSSACAPSTRGAVTDWVDQLVGGAARVPRRDRGRGAGLRGGGRRPPARRARRGRARRPARTSAPSRCPPRCSTSSPATPAPTVRSSCSTPPPATASAPSRCAPRSRR